MYSKESWLRSTPSLSVSPQPDLAAPRCDGTLEVGYGSGRWVLWHDSPTEGQEYPSKLR